MRRMVFLPVVVAALATLTVRAQDGNAVLNEAARALGAGNLATIQYSGTGANYSFGQAWRADLPWPEFKVTRYVASVNYATPAMRVELERTNPDQGARGGGGLPLLAPQQQNQAVSGSVAWNVAGQTATPAAAAVSDRLLALWTTPHGVIKAAMNAGARTVVTRHREVDGRTTTTIHYPAGSTSVKATLNAEHLVDRVETVADTPMLGDTVTETIYSNYRDFSGVKFPTRIQQRQGGHPVLDLTITDVRPNAAVALGVPPNVRQAGTAPAQPAAAPAPSVAIEKLADGVYYVAGQSHHSVAVEFKDHVVLIETPQNEARTTAVFEAVRKTIPNKPIRYAVNTHLHFDHAGGIRAAVAEGATIITHVSNKPLYERMMTMPHTINPDRLAQSPKQAVIETVADRRVLTDGKRRLELHRLRGSVHSDTMLVAYLPAERILIEADVYTPPAANAPTQTNAPINPATVNLYDNIQRLRLRVDRIAALHGRVATMAELTAAAGKPAKPSTH